jgi:hypothetical protein
MRCGNVSTYFNAASDVDEAKLVGMTNIARAQIAVSVHNRRSVARVIQVTHKHMPSAHQNLNKTITNRENTF